MRPAATSGPKSHSSRSSSIGKYCTQRIGKPVRLHVALDLVADAGIHVVGPGQHEHARAPLAGASGQDLPALRAASAR